MKKEEKTEKFMMNGWIHNNNVQKSIPDHFYEDDMSAMEIKTVDKQPTILWFMLQAVENKTGQNFLKLSTSAGRTTGWVLSSVTTILVDLIWFDKFINTSCKIHF